MFVFLRRPQGSRLLPSDWTHRLNAPMSHDRAQGLALARQRTASAGVRSVPNLLSKGHLTLSLENGAERAPTIYDVAKHAGVSHQTVSRLLKGQKISPAFKLRVDQALADLNYRPNLAARSLATRQSNRIATLMYEMGELGPIKIMQSASSAARKAGYVLDIVHLDPSDNGSLDEAIAILNQLDVAGILAFAPNDRTRAQLTSAQFRVPIYFEAENDDVDLQQSDRPNFNAIGAELAMNHLLDLGHRSIAHISGPLDWPSARLRARSYRESATRHQLPDLPVFEGDWSAESGFRRTVEILALGSKVTAIFAANDQMALGALHALAQQGVSVPGAVSVVGMDDTPEARFYNPSLSTVPMHFDVQGRYAFEAVLARINGNDVAVKTDYVHTALIQRASTGAPLGV